MTKQEIQNKICEIVKEHSPFNSDEIALDHDLRDNYGVDSIALVEMLVDIECHFDIAFDSSLLTYDNFSTAGTIADYICEKLNTGVA